MDYVSYKGWSYVFTRFHFNIAFCFVYYTKLKMRWDGSSNGIVPLNPIKLICFLMNNDFKFTVSESSYTEGISDSVNTDQSLEDERLECSF